VKQGRELAAVLHMTTTSDNDGDRVIDRSFLQRNQYWVVIVDDEEAIRLPVGDYLYDEGYQVTACADAAALLEEVLPQYTVSPTPRLPDAIVSDIRMPEMDGLELLAKIRENPSWARIPVILLTAKGLTSDRVTGYKAGADAYITKPFDPEELLSLLDNLILRRNQLQQGPSGLTDLQNDLVSIKQLMQDNAKKVVKSTPVFLTTTERSVLERVCKGETNAEIAASVGLSTDKVSRTLTKLYQMTECQTRTELVRWAFDTGYASPY
jgi:DNA-binding response OmpR family regulator